ncbi:MULTISPECIES: hypothetical protein [Mycobacteriaceae]|uniref:hypothetical protein n=1 Tax=Mycobacteriaceae TaxID=1762 RepID=UPI00104259DA|nr:MULTISPECIES: hypothetical protein [Mycobacteriaceae]
MMNAHDVDVARFRRAGELLARESLLPLQGPEMLEEHRIRVRGVVYAGTAAAAARVMTLRADEGYSYADALIEVLTADRLGNQSANELGVLNCLRAENWIQAVRVELCARAGEIAVPTLTDTERFHRLAAVEYALDHARFDGNVSTAAVVAFVEVMAAARVRWHLGEFDLMEDMDPADLIRDVVTAEPVAATADAELDEGWKRSAAQFMSENWDEIREKAADLEAATAIETTEVGPAQRVEAARRGARRYMQELGREHGVDWNREYLSYAAAVAAGRAQWQETGGDPQQQDLFEVQAPGMDPASGADQLTDETREQVRQLVASAWAEIAGDTAAV